MSDFSFRMKAEKSNLELSIVSLDLFIADNPLFHTLPDDEQILMHKQSRVMKEYAAILEKRIGKVFTTPTYQ